jgi:WhiB family redox-sensing transcriptional regulator
MASMWSVVEDQSWMDSANCKGMTHLFYSPHVHGPECNNECVEGRKEKGRNQRVNEARALCAGCPVRAECLQFAMVTMQLDGVWGGLTERERQDMRSIQRAVS